MNEIRMPERDIARFESIVGSEAMDRIGGLASSVLTRLDGRSVWNVNSTAAGGGVAEMLQSLLPYARGAGIDARWMVMRANDDFFAVTKRLHHALHGSAGDGSPLGDKAHEIYDTVTRENAAAYASQVREGDVVILHDPQTAGLAPYLIDKGALVIWRCHIGKDTVDDEVTRGWRFLSHYLEDVPAFVFTRESYVPDYCDHGKSSIITPSIDAFSPKNQSMSDEQFRAILVNTGILRGVKNEAAATFVREDGSQGSVAMRARIVREGRVPSAETPLVVQVSRWDPLKDPIGVMRGFVRMLDLGDESGSVLMLVGPDASAVADDPEGARVYREVVETRAALPPHVRCRIQLVSLPMTDVQENGAVVNAIQRQASVVVQKSLMEGFGLTVTEAMWKGRPVVASPVGGILDQIDHGRNGLLLQDAHDLDGLAEKLASLVANPRLGSWLGENARRRVGNEFLGIQHLAKYGGLIGQLIEERERAGNPRRFTAADRGLDATTGHPSLAPPAAPFAV